MNWLTTLLRRLLDFLRWLLGLLRGGTVDVDVPAHIAFTEVDPDPVLLVAGSRASVRARAVTAGGRDETLTGTLIAPDGTTAPLAFRAALTTPEETSWEADGPLPVAAAGSWRLSLAYGKAEAEVTFTAEEPDARRATRFPAFDVTPEEEDAGTPILLRGALEVQVGGGQEFAGFADQPVTLEFRYPDSFAWIEITDTVTGPRGNFEVTVTAEESGFWRAAYDPPEDVPGPVMTFAADQARAASATRGARSREARNTARVPPEFLHVRIFSFAASPSTIGSKENVVFSGYLRRRREKDKNTKSWENYSGRSVGVKQKDGSPSGADVTRNNGFFTVGFTPGETGTWKAHYQKRGTSEGNGDASVKVKRK
ncbi:hypothetical protein GCM10009530_22740 [Microbispora corallina]|uniref:Htaa domain-containing protein n=1 Tax=Microbispora corallina TaxID=83302 RepID=A0ABQ4G6A9_9ACTN|nr:hypothetical protein [Microbispora corallina]GIH42616.1 hypothetical protein Mco01_56160 [Microbispora corallina]